MVLQSRSPHARILALACLIGCGLAVTGPSQAVEGRPPLSAACEAWKSHIAGLLDQHRTAREIDDDQFGEIIRLFYEAQSTCAALHFQEGLALYEAIPIGPVASRPLR